MKAMMKTASSSAAAEALVDVVIEAPAWSAALPGVEGVIRGAAIAALGSAPDWVTGGVAILLTDDEAVRDLNNRFRDRDSATNVLSFPAPPNPENHLGDIALAFGICDAEAREAARPLVNHLRHLIIHGVLHLLGYDHRHEAEAEEMESLERDLLAGLGVPDPYEAAPPHG